MPDVTGRLSTALADRYRIERHVGEGGMATVYLAEDLKHDRKVALKVLRPELAAVIGAERFLQEIKVTAGLQHPHILPLHDSGDADGFLYYVMPYVEGETLRERLDREKQLGVEDAVEITRSVAAALDYAHRRGVIHRDIKPENILLHDGQPLVADFGIALAVSAAGGARLTETGLSLGTPHYMSPEQATGDRTLDARSDVYSLGAVLYEMLVGDPPYTGSTAQAIIAKVITEQAPQLTVARPTVPANVASAVHKALAKLPADRFTTTAQFAEALSNPTFTVAMPAASGLAAPPSRLMPRSRRWAWPAAAALLAGLALWGWFRPAPTPAVARYGLAFPPGQELVDVVQPTFALAPDGSWIVYEGPAESGRQLWVKRRDQYEATPLPGTLGAGMAPTVSPDGAWIAFTAGGQLRKIPRGGGSAITLADSVSGNTRGVAWLDDGTIVYRDVEDRLRQVSELGGQATVIWTPPAGQDLRPILPTPLPDGRGVLFTACYSTSCLPLESWALDLRTGEARLLVSDVARAWYTATGHLVYVRPDGGVFAAPFDLGSLNPSGPSVPVLEGVQVGGGRVPDFALSVAGTLLMVAGPATDVGASSEAVWVSRDGSVGPVDPEWRFTTVGNRGWALSPDGARLAIQLLRDGNQDIWVKELNAGPLSRLTTHDADEYRPRWTPDARSISFISVRGTNQDVYIRRADGTQPPQLLVDLEDPVLEAFWSRDGRWLVLRIGGAGANRDIWAMQVGTDSAPRRLLATDFDERAVSLSPDANWMVYQSDETGQEEIYVRPFPDISAGKWVISIGGGEMPLWAHNGREIFYVDGERRMAVATVRTGTGGIEVLRREPLFSTEGYILTANYTPFDITPDDRRFLMVRPVGSEEAGRRPLILVENWFEELKQKVGR